MKIYNYDENLFYIGESLADESPLEPGVYLIPAKATVIKPLPEKEGFINKFNSEKNVFEYFEIIKNQEQEQEKESELSEKEILSQDLQKRIKEYKYELSLLDWINLKYIREVQILQTMTNEEYCEKYKDQFKRISELVKLINELEVQLNNIN